MKCHFAASSNFQRERTIYMCVNDFDDDDVVDDDVVDNDVVDDVDDDVGDDVDDDDADDDDNDDVDDDDVDDGTWELLLGNGQDSVSDMRLLFHTSAREMQLRGAPQPPEYDLHW
jgi:hypothetical protein